MSGIGEGRLLLSEEDRREYERSTERQTLIDTVSGLPHFYDRPEFAHCSEKRARYRISHAEEPDAIRKILFGRRAAVWNYVGPKEYPCRIAFDLGLCEGDSGFVL